jgi:hypothetical protein
MKIKSNQNIWDLAIENDLKDLLKKNEFPLDGKIANGIEFLGNDSKYSNNHSLNANDLKKYIECYNNCWLCDGTWSAVRLWKANCIWKTI